MEKSQLISVLRSLNAYEMNSLGKFINSPYFNSNEKIIIYFDHVKEYLKNRADGLTKENIYHKLYPGEVYNDGRFRYLTSEMLRLVEEFLGQENLKKDRFNICISSFKELMERKHGLLAAKKLNEAGKFLTSSNYPNEVLYYYKHLYDSNSGYLMMSQDKLPDPENVTGEAENIILLMITVIFQSSFNINTLSRSFNLKTGYNIILDFLGSFDMQGFLIKLRAIKHNKAGLIEIYYDLLQLIKMPEDTAAYYRIKCSLNSVVKEINRLDIYNIISALRSYCVQRELEGKSEFYAERFELNKLSLELDAYSHSEQRYMQLNDFRSFLNAALSFKEYDWAERFIGEYSCKLKPELQENAMQLALATIAFHKKDYDGARKHLAVVRPDTLYLKHDVKRLELAICYEKGEYSAALEMIDSYKHFLKSNKGVSELRKDAVWNYLKIAMDIVRIRIGESRKSPVVLLRTLEIIKPLSNKVWLKEKLKELISN